MVHLNLSMMATSLPPAAVALVAALVGVLIGAALWVTGARYSRGLITLSAVALGTVLGRELPALFRWSIDGMGPAIGAAIVFGVAAFVFHRAWVGLGLGLILALWAALAVWFFLPEMRRWTMPTLSSGAALPALSTWATDLWASFPLSARKLLPFACGAGLLSGIGLTVRCPRIAVAMLYSFVGVSVFMIMGQRLLELGPAQLNQMKLWMPIQAWAQAATLAGLVAFGTLLQWRLAPAMSKPAASQSQRSAPAEVAHEKEED